MIRIEKLLVMFCCVAFCPVWLSGQETAPTVMPIEDLRLPLERYDDGTVKTRLLARTAKVPEDGGPITATKVRVEAYYPDETLEALLLASSCQFDRRNGKASSTQSVCLRRKDIVITGKGFEWDSKDKMIKIHSNAKVVLLNSDKRAEDDKDKK